MDDLPWKDILVGTISSILTAVIAAIAWLANYPKWRAEIDRLQRESGKFEAEAQELTSTRILRELDRLASINDEQSKLLQTQKTEIESLRTEIISYAVREQAHASENSSLKLRIKELEAMSNSTMSMPEIPLKTIYPPEIIHIPNENDGLTPPKDRK